ncbi:MAG TPA: trypsin-like peptidase domain-containing protein [Anaerolineales bacterium]|nr:trypsin-like peptidase domain-containing protein [Anaerolineales bacterium]
MNQHPTNRIWLGIAVLALAALACQVISGGPVVTSTPSQTQPTPVTPNNSNSSSADPVHATVQVLMQAQQGDQFESFSWGSGTLLNAKGMILTNAHVASPATQGNPENEPDRLVIALIESEDKPPVPAYIATVQAVDGYLDLAVLQIVSTLDGTSLDMAQLDLPFVQLGNSDGVRLGDHLNIFGFPSIGGETITFTDGNVSGFVPDDQIGNRAWIKTDATISGGNSGGLASNDAGEIIGVPTIAASGAERDVTDCRVVQDTNGDGQLTKEDTCIPIGGFINALRPVNLALPLIEAARAHKQYVSPYQIPGTVTTQGTGQEAAANFIWFDTSNSSTETCEWNTDIPVTAYPNSTLCIATGFEYSGMTDGEPGRELWYLNGQPTVDYPFAWEWGAEGRFVTYLPNKGDPMPPGEYYLELYAGGDDHLIGTSGRVVVGNGASSPTPQPAQGDTIALYGVVYDVDTNNPISAYVYILQQGITYEQWQSENFQESSIAARLQTDEGGQYEITGIPRNIEFTFVVYAEGYNIHYENNLVADENTDARVNVDIGLTR